MANQIMVRPEKFEELVKNVYFNCTNKNPKGLYVGEVDLLEFAARLISAWESAND